MVLTRQQFCTVKVFRILYSFSLNFMSTFSLFGVPVEVGLFIFTVSFGIVFIVISKLTQQESQSLKCRNIPLLLIDDYQQCDSAIINFLSYKPLIIGMDCEWKPYFDNKDENKNKVSLIQLSHHKQCLLIRIQKIINDNNGGIPLQLIGLLSNPSIIKTGLNLTGDAKKLYEDYQLSLRGTVELTHLIKQKCKFYSSIDLNKHNIQRLNVLSSLLLHIEMDKCKEITLSNWENPKLTDKQIQYAADDAIISYFLFIQCIYHREYENVVQLKYDELGFNEPDQHLLSFDIDEYFKDKENDFCLKICYGIIDVKVIKLEQKINRKKNIKVLDNDDYKDVDGNGYDTQQRRLRLKQERKQKYRERASRSKPLYENCRLLDLNGNLIANCSTKTLKVKQNKVLFSPVLFAMDIPNFS